MPCGPVPSASVFVNVPVKAFTAVRKHDVHFRQLEDRKGGKDDVVESDEAEGGEEAEVLDLVAVLERSVSEAKAKAKAERGAGEAKTKAPAKANAAARKSA